MATNLRLRPAAAEALRERARSSGLSQQQLIRQAVDQFLGLVNGTTSSRQDIDDLIARGILNPATPYRRAAVRLKLPEGVTSVDLLNREDRV